MLCSCGPTAEVGAAAELTFKLTASRSLVTHTREVGAVGLRPLIDGEPLVGLLFVCPRADDYLYWAPGEILSRRQLREGPVSGSSRVAEIFGGSVDDPLCTARVEVAAEARSITLSSGLPLCESSANYFDLSEEDFVEWGELIDASETVELGPEHRACYAADGDRVLPPILEIGLTAPEDAAR